MARKRAKASGRRTRKPAKPPRSTSPPPAADPTSLTAAAAARLLRVPVEAITRHIELGAPADPEGRLNLIHYAAWLLRQLAESATPS
ncbi:MAG TPA: hypothetical protein VMY35_10445 [Phycisphaerae bacterium]|nr:hypothetical protein [Phycisphaerae bacterium]